MADEQRVVVSRDGELACLVEPQQVTVFALPSLEQLGEVGVELGSEVAFAGDRLCVLAPGGVLHVVEPRGKDGPEKVAELALEAGMRILAASGDHVLVGSITGAAVASLGERPGFARLPSRSAITAAAPGSEPDHFVVITAGVVEEWSAVTRTPLRRFRLDRPITAGHVAATARHVWIVAESQVTVLPTAAAGRPTAIDLPEEAMRIAAEPAGNQLAVVGASGAVCVVGPGDRAAHAVHPGPASDVAWRDGALICACGGGLEVVELGRAGNGRKRAAEPAVVVPPAEPSTLDRLAAWKHRMAARSEPVPADDDEITNVHEWRDALVRWGRRVLGGGQADPPLLAAGPLYDVGARLGITGEDATMLWLVYAARLCGHDGVAPADLVDVCPRRWDDALGNTKLAATGAFHWRHARVGLTPEIAAALDELPPLHGTAVPSAIDVARTVAVHAREVELGALAAWAAPRLGALLVPSARGLARPARFLLEARARGLAPVIPWCGQPRIDLPAGPGVVVVDDPAIAAELAIPLALTWGGSDPSS